MKRAILRTSDWSRGDVEEVLELARVLKDERRRGVSRDSLRGKHVALYLEKPSVRTRVSFTVATRELGGDVVELTGHTTKVGHGEHPFDFAAVLARYCHAIVARVFADEALRSIADGAAAIPVVNALSDEHHPCQSLADALTLKERFGDAKGLTVAYVGDGRTNVVHSLVEMGALLGFEVRVACPPGFEPDPAIHGRPTIVRDAREAVRGADAVYTDTWVSMGKEEETDERRRALSPYKLDRALFDLASPRAIVLHCLPAVRDEEIDAELLHDARSAVLDQAENRLHTEKALLSILLAP